MNGTNGHGNGHAHGDPFGHGGFNAFDIPPDFDANEPPPDDDDQSSLSSNEPPVPPKSWNFDHFPTMSWWAQQQLPPRDLLLGEILATDTRMLLVGKTGLGKTNFGLAFSIAIASGAFFLHWNCPRPARVLYIDGELSPRLMQKWLDDAARRNGGPTDNLMVMSAQHHPNMKPLNTPEGQNYVDQFIDFLGGSIDLIVFDNVQALLPGNQRETDAWSGALNWQREITAAGMGQVWMCHASDDDTLYGDKTRSWQMDAVALMRTAVHPNGKGLAFNLSFDQNIGGKARERTPSNYQDFEDALIYLDNDLWLSNRGVSSNIGTVENIALQAFDLAINNGGGKPYTGANTVPPGTLTIERQLWLAYFKKLYVGANADDGSLKAAFNAAAKKLQLRGRIAFDYPQVYRL